MRENIDRRSSSYIAWEVYHEAGRARMGFFSSFAGSGARAEVPKKFLKKDIANQRVKEMSLIEIR